MLLLKYNVRLLYIPSHVYDSFHFGIKLILFAKHIGHLRLSKLVGYLLVIKMQDNGYSINKDYLQYYMLPSCLGVKKYSVFESASSHIKILLYLISIHTVP